MARTTSLANEDARVSMRDFNVLIRRVYATDRCQLAIPIRSGSLRAWSGPGSPQELELTGYTFRRSRVRERVVRRYRFRPITHSGRGQAYAFSVPWLPNGVLPRGR